MLRREAMQAVGKVAAGLLLVPQDYQQPGDQKGKRGKIRPEQIKSGTLFGQYQLRGSILTIKDASTTASGFMAFGSDMSTVPTTSASGTGVYIDYTGIYGLSSGTKQFYLQASDGKAVAGAGAVTLDADGITLLEGNADINFIKWATSGGTVVGIEYTDLTSNNVSRVSYPTRSANTDRVVYQLSANADPTTGQSPSLGLFLVAHGSTHATNASETWLNVLTNGVQTLSGVGIGLATSLTKPSSLLHLRSTAPTFRMEDSTASAKSLLVTVDANVAKFEEVGGNDLLYFDLANLSVVVGNAAIATNATAGFLYIPTCAGAPTGVPTAYTGRAPIVIDSTNNKMYIYSGGAWVALN